MTVRVRLNKHDIDVNVKKNKKQNKTKNQTQNKTKQKTTLNTKRKLNDITKAETPCFCTLVTSSLWIK